MESPASFNISTPLTETICAESSVGATLLYEVERKSVQQKETKEMKTQIEFSFAFLNPFESVNSVDLPTLR
jgi:hypothetical protein